MISEQEAEKNINIPLENAIESDIEKETMTMLFGIPFARDKREATFAIIVIITLFVNTIYLLTQYITSIR